MSATPSVMDRVRDFLDRGLWAHEPGRGPAGWALGFLQLTMMAGEGFFVRHQLLLRASALTYVAMLSLIPLIALALAIADAVGAGISGRLAPLIVQQVSAGSPEASAWILDRIENIEFGNLGTVGSVALFLTTVLAIGNVERALNEIWGPVPQRPWSRRLPDYLAVLVVSPILLGAALVLTTTLQSQALVQRFLEVDAIRILYDFGLRQLPLLFLCAGFAFLYWFLPNTLVRVRSALLGGLVAALLFVVAQRLYLDLQVGAARANAVFGTLSALPLLLVWIYSSCTIMLLGAEVAYAHQNLKLYRRELRGRPTGTAEREEIALAVAALIGKSFREGREAWTEDGLADVLEVPVRTVREIVADLYDGGIVSRRGEEHPGELQLARPGDRITVADILHTLRGSRRGVNAVPRVAAVVSELLSDIDRVESEKAGGCSLRDLVERLPAGVEPASTRD